ncbi:MAG: DUF3108 domain-containing protein [Candidatus Omnitrophota bacterium]
MLKTKTPHLSILLPLLILILIALLFLREKINIYTGNSQRLTSKAILPVNNTENDLSHYVGERITYDVKMGGMRLGKASSNILANEKLNGRSLNVMTMDTRLTNFNDSEKIYSDPKTLLPVKVERNILNFISREKITEDYDQDNFTVTIIKRKGAKDQRLVIKKEGHINNAVLLPYYVRSLPALEVGKIITANLPTRNLEIKLVAIEDVKVPAGTFKAYRFQSTPKHITIWISADERRIPLKIVGSGLMSYSMFMREYTPGS